MSKLREITPADAKRARERASGARSIGERDYTGAIWRNEVKWREMESKWREMESKWREMETEWREMETK